MKPEPALLLCWICRLQIMSMNESESMNVESSRGKQENRLRNEDPEDARPEANFGYHSYVLSICKKQAEQSFLGSTAPKRLGAPWTLFFLLRGDVRRSAVAMLTQLLRGSCEASKTPVTAPRSSGGFGCGHKCPF